MKIADRLWRRFRFQFKRYFFIYPTMSLSQDDYIVPTAEMLCSIQILIKVFFSEFLKFFLGSGIRMQHVNSRGHEGVDV